MDNAAGEEDAKASDCAAEAEEELRASDDAMAWVRYLKRLQESRGENNPQIHHQNWHTNQTCALKEKGGSTSKIDKPFREKRSTGQNLTPPKPLAWL